ncbi:MAG: SH3 domain-containing protein [Bdellovibrionota bacterium]|nr:SH3 domain-containing protein [Bdellovibrionota bacterium]
MFGKSVLLKGILFFFISLSVFAAQRAEVIIDGAMVYKKGDFGAPVLGYLRKGKLVKISNKNYGPFYKVKLRQGVIGYISDIDIRIVSGPGGRKVRAAKRSGARPNSRVKRPQKDVRGKSYWGLSLAMVNFTDRFKLTSGSDSTEATYSSQSLFLMLNRTAPFSLLDGVVNLDINFGVSTSTPSIYTDISSQSSGYVILTDASLMMPLHLLRGKNFFTYFGAGLMASHSIIDLYVSGTNLPIGKTRVGASISGGGAYTLGKFLLKFEPKYYFEEERYLGFHFGLQRAF